MIFMVYGENLVEELTCVNAEGSGAKLSWAILREVTCQNVM